MQIANPIYDVVFKYLMEDSKIARLMISLIIEEKVVSLDFKPQENTVKLKQTGLTVYRLDFSAKIETPKGNKQVLIEIQKAKFATDIIRFRRYLGSQYGNQENTCSTTINGKETVIGIPIITIYFLGYELGQIDAPLIRVKRGYYDVRNDKKIETKSEFIESLTHDSFIIQIPHLRKKYKTEVEQLLSVFDQNNKLDAHILNIKEEEYPEKFRPLIRRLQRAIAEPEIQKTMDLEDEILGELQNKEREIAKKNDAIKEQEKVIQEKGKVIQEKNNALQEKNNALQEKNNALQEQEKVIQEKGKVIQEKDSEIIQQRKEIEELRKKLGGVQPK